MSLLKTGAYPCQNRGRVTHRQNPGGYSFLGDLRGSAECGRYRYRPLGPTIRAAPCRPCLKTQSERSVRYNLHIVIARGICSSLNSRVAVYRCLRLVYTRRNAQIATAAQGPVRSVIRATELQRCPDPEVLSHDIDGPLLPRRQRIRRNRHAADNRCQIRRPRIRHTAERPGLRAADIIPTLGVIHLKVNEFIGTRSRERGCLSRRCGRDSLRQSVIWLG